MFIETSAKMGFNVKALFKKLALALPGGQPKPKPAGFSSTSSVDIDLSGNNAITVGSQQRIGGIDLDQGSCPC